jgi:type VI secretion system protein VasG
VDNILSNTLLPEISRLLLSAMAEGLRPTALRVGVNDTGDFTYEPVVTA